MALHDKLGTAGDTFYSTLMDAHDGLSQAQSHALNTRLVLIMANEIADLDVLQNLVREAAQGSKTGNKSSKPPGQDHD